MLPNANIHGHHVDIAGPAASRLVSTVIGGAGAVALYAVCARLLGIDEFSIFVRSITGRLGRL